MARVALGSPVLLYLRLEHVPPAALQLVADLLLVVAEHRPVVVVEVFDDLKRPPPVQDVAADELGSKPVRDGVVAGVAQLVARVTEEQVGAAHQLMEGVQLAACPLHPFQCFRDGAHCFHGGVVHPGRSAVVIVGSGFGFTHGPHRTHYVHEMNFAWERGASRHQIA